jgi:hypothetical protein
MDEALSDGAERLDAADEVEENELVQENGVDKDNESAEVEDEAKGATEAGAERDEVATKAVAEKAAAVAAEAKIGVTIEC